MIICRLVEKIEKQHGLGLGLIDEVDS